MIKLGLVGEKLGHSFSPEIHKFILEKIGVKGEYSLIEIPREKSKDILEIVRKKGITGFNITVPYKEVLFDKLDWVSDEAKEIGAINTVLLREDKSYGYNTDYYGVIKMLNEKNIDVTGKKCYILGTGGGAKSIIVALKKLGADEINLVSRNSEEKKTKLLERFPYIRVIDYNEIDRGDLIINATPLGMYPNIEKTLVGKEILKKFKYAADIIYNPEETLFLKNARECGLVTVNGLSMLVEQGIKAEEIWQNRKFDSLLYRDLLKYLGGKI